MDDPPVQRFQINPNTGISVGIVLVMFGGFFAVMSGINSMKTEVRDARGDILAARLELNLKIEKVEDRMKIVETNKSVVTGVEFYKWAIHLQQLNRDPKKLQAEGLNVPEPEVTSK